MINRVGWRAATLRAFAFEDVVADLFRQLGYKVTMEAELGDFGVDLLVERDGEQRPVEISATRANSVMQKVRRDAERLRSLSELDTETGKPILAVASAMTDEARTWAQQEYDVEIWDFDILLRRATPFPNLVERLRAFAAGSIDEPPQASSELTQDLQKRLADHIKKNELSPSDYEALCLAVFVHLFDPDLYGFAKQAQTTDGGNRYDFICRIQPGNTFWDGLRSDFRTKAILFECKNYSAPITADQVYSTERYLFAGALRTVCFLISRLVPSESAIRAAQGAMRESGKLILLLWNADLIEMLKLKSQPRAPENYLDKKIWDFIVSLPR